MALARSFIKPEIFQIHRINAVATSVLTTMCIQKRTELDRYRQQRRKARSGKPAILIHISSRTRGCLRRMPENLRRTTTDAKNHQKMAADAFPAFEKHKVMESNPPCGCPMGCVAHCMGGVFCRFLPFLGDGFVLRSSLLPTCGFHASFQTWPCHALTLHQVSPPRLGPATF